MEHKEITISLIIPVYKVAAYIERCLRSVIKQTYDHFECILVDDASPDDSIAVCERIIAEYEGPIRFRILRHEQNRGLSAARNTAIDAATGDYLLFIDSDDLVSDDCVERLMTPLLSDPGIEMVIGEHLRFSDKGLIEQSKRRWRSEEDLPSREAVRDLYFDAHRQLPPSAWNKLISRSFVNKYQLRFREGQLWEDVLWSFFVMKHLSHLYVIPDVTYFYYLRPDSISTATNREEKLKHHSMISSTISAHFTPGDEGREAAHYLEGFFHHYIRLPKTKELQATALRFSKALSFRRYPREKTLLWAARLLPHNRTGRDFFKWLRKQLLA